MKRHTLRFVMFLLLANSATAGDVAQHFTNEYLGTPASCPSTGSEGPDGPSAPIPNVYRGNPVSLLTGNKFQEELVYRGTGEFPLEYKLHYNSFYKGRDVIIGRWTASYSQHIRYDKSTFSAGTNTKFIMYQVDGSELVFYGNKTSLTTNQQLPNPYVTVGKISYSTTANEFIYTRPDGFYEFFNADGDLTKIQSPEGLTHQISTINEGQKRFEPELGANMCYAWEENDPSTPSDNKCIVKYDKEQLKNWICRDPTPDTYAGKPIFRCMYRTNYGYPFAHKDAACIETSRLLGENNKCIKWELKKEGEYVETVKKTITVTDNNQNKLVFSTEPQLVRSPSDTMYPQIAPYPYEAALCQGCAKNITYTGVSADCRDGVITPGNTSGCSNITANRVIGINSNNMISSVTNPDGVRIFSYHSDSCTTERWLCTSLSGIKDEEGITYASWAYRKTGTDKQPKAIQGHHASEDIFNYEYTNGHQRIVKSGPQGAAREQTFNFTASAINGGTYIHLDSVTGAGGTSCANSSMSYAYNPLGQTQSINIGNEKKIDYTYYPSPDGRVETITDAKGQPTQSKIKFTWDSRFARKVQKEEYFSGLPSSGSPDGEKYREIIYDYYGNGRLKSIEAASKRGVHYSSKTSYTYEYWDTTTQKKVKKISIDGPRVDLVDVTTINIDEQGRVSSIVNPLNQSVVFSNFQEHGLPRIITDENGIKITLAYNSRGMPTSISSNNTTLTSTYYKNGLLKTMGTSEQNSQSYYYTDGRKLKRVVDATGAAIEMVPSGYNLDATLDEFNVSVYSDFANNLKDSTVKVKINALNKVYQIFGNRNSTDGEEAGSQTFHYDGLGRLAKTENGLSLGDIFTTNIASNETTKNQIVTLPDSKTITTTYDADGLIESVKDQRGNITTYKRDGLGRVYNVISPDTGDKTYQYDEAGNLTYNGLRNKKFRYDALNRPIFADLFPLDASKGKVFTYDSTDDSYGKGKLATAVHNLYGTSIAYKYNVNGQVKSKALQVDGKNFPLSFGYNNEQQLTSITYPSGRVVGYERGAMGRLTSVSTTYAGLKQPIANNFKFLGTSQQKQYTYGNGVVYSGTFTNLLEKRNVEHIGISQQKYIYKGSGLVGEIRDLRNTNNTKTLVYDAVGRLKSDKNTFRFYEFTYDAVGNRLTKKKDGTVIDTFVIKPTSNQIDTQNGSPHAYTWAAGATYSESLFDYTYDTFGNLSNIMNFATGFGGLLKYDAFGIRVRKYSKGITTYFVYDDNTRLMAELDENASVIREYIYGEENLMAIFSPLDTDGDGMDDDWEKMTFGDLSHDARTDSDGDKVTDAMEYKKNFNPNDAGVDGDGDGILDTWELANFGALSRDGSGDFDKDGFSDLVEFNNGYDPLKDQLFWLVPVLFNTLN